MKRIIVITSIGLFLYVGVIAAGAFEYDSFTDMFKVEGGLKLSSLIIQIGSSFTTGSQNPYVAVANNIIFRGPQSSYKHGAELSGGMLSLSRIIISHAGDLDLSSQSNADLQLRVPDNQAGVDLFQLRSENNITVSQGVVVGVATQQSINTLKTQILDVVQSLIPLSGNKVTFGLGDTKTILKLNTPTSVNTISYRNGAVTDSLCKVMGISYNSVNQTFSQTCSDRFGTGYYLADANYDSGQVLCCSGCDSDGSTGGALPRCAQGVTIPVGSCSDINCNDLDMYILATNTENREDRICFANGKRWRLESGETNPNFSFRAGSPPKEAKINNGTNYYYLADGFKDWPQDGYGYASCDDLLVKVTRRGCNLTFSYNNSTVYNSFVSAYPYDGHGYATFDNPLTAEIKVEYSGITLDQTKIYHYDAWNLTSTPGTPATQRSSYSFNIAPYQCQ